MSGEKKVLTLYVGGSSPTTYPLGIGGYMYVLLW